MLLSLARNKTSLEAAQAGLASPLLSPKVRTGVDWVVWIGNWMPEVRTCAGLRQGEAPLGEVRALALFRLALPELPQEECGRPRLVAGGW